MSFNNFSEKSLNGRVAADQILNKIKNKSFKFKPCLAIVQIGNNSASDLYVKFKIKKATEVEIKTQFLQFDESISYEDLFLNIQKLNENRDVHGIIIQLPLPVHLHRIVEVINYDKDVDGLTCIQQGNLLLEKDGLFPCTALGVIQLLKFYNIELKSKKIAVIGRSYLVGKPLALMLLNENALVSILHSKIDENLMKKELLNSDIICSAVGKKHFIKNDFIKKKAILIDIGVTKDDFGTFGDVDPECYAKSLFYTPNIGGVGPMTIACLLSNIIKAYENLNG